MQRVVTFTYNLDPRDSPSRDGTYVAQIRFASYDRSSIWSMNIEFIHGFSNKREVVHSVSIYGNPEDKMFSTAVKNDSKTSSEIAHYLFMKYVIAPLIGANDEDNWFKKHAKHTFELLVSNANEAINYGQITFIFELDRSDGVCDPNALVSKFEMYVRFETFPDRTWSIDVNIIREIPVFRLFDGTGTKITREVVIHRKIEGKNEDLMLAKAVNNADCNYSCDIAQMLFWNYIVVPSVDETNASKNWLKINAPLTYNKFESFVLHERNNECRTVHET